MPRRPLVPRRSADWHSHFTRNAAAQRPIRWHTWAGVSAEELLAIGPSLAAWQLGESSDGAHLTAAAVCYTARTGDGEFVDVARLFIIEEQRHGMDPTRYLWTDPDPAPVGKLAGAR